MRGGARGTYVAAAGLVALSAQLAARARVGDYAEEVQPTIEALLAGDPGAVTSGYYLMGPLSIVLRLPAAALVDAAGGDALLVYRAGVFVCLLAAVALGLVLRGRALSRGVNPWAAAAIAVLTVVNPPTVTALAYGHPEEVLTAALAVGAVLAALDGRLRWSVVLIVAAVLSKQWALLAIPVVLVAAGHRWRLVLAQTAVLGTLLAAPVVLADPGRFLATVEHLAAVTDEASRQWGAVLAQNVWWPLATPEPVRVFDGVEMVVVEPRRLGDPYRSLARPLMGLIVLGLAIAVARARRRDVLALLAAVFLIRSMLDPANGSYYHVPLVMSLVAWDARTRPWPSAALLVSSLLWVTFERIQPIRDFALTNAVYLGWTVPALVWLAVAAIRPRPAPSGTA